MAFKGVGHPVEGKTQLTHFIPGYNIDAGMKVASGNIFGDVTHLG
jgi:hypothetical protein